jgi:flavin reductase (DIM6/NTAB) family NADH-FMN oxidoreductase RutF
VIPSVPQAPSAMAATRAAVVASRGRTAAASYFPAPDLDPRRMAPPETDDFRSAMAVMPTAVTVIASVGESGAAGATANAVASLSLEPPLMLVCLDRGSRTLAAVRSSGRFSVNVLGAGDEQLARAFASKAPHEEKWAGIEWEERDGMPRIADALAWIACELRDLLDGGDHVIVTGAVLDLAVNEDAAPLVFHHGEYRALG